ncbi:MAG: phosphoribosylformylglycinamidine synthase subunit PurQ [Oligoflexia bacterium]|nr:phosphoribosylformylglycinamidine synthase subunit PurQ [Oligoflexia bacterium]
MLRFLGTNCDADVYQAIKDLGHTPEYLWWSDRFDWKSYSALVLPGGFSYGDYLRAGALAAQAPAMDDVKQAAKSGVPILGICNGFQILCEAGLLSGALTKNISRQFQDEWVEVELVGSDGPWTQVGQKSFRLPIAHSMGRYFAPKDTLKALEDDGLIWLKYKRNPNGSLHDISGILNKNRNVAALMPHPERAIHSWMGSSDGRSLLQSGLGGAL